MTNTFHLLLVEDKPQTAQMVRFYLEREGFSVTVATDGPSGEAVFGRQTPQLTILDIYAARF